MANQTTPAIQIKDSNVGIGTSSPAYKLDVSGSLNVAANVYNYIGGNKAFGGNGSTFLYLYTGTTALSILNNADSSELVRITNDGNVGIGTTSPSFKLDVNGNTRIGGNSGSNTARLNVGGAANEWVADFQASTTTNQSYGLVVRAGTSSTDFPFYVLDSSSSTAFFAIKGNGNVGIGTTAPQVKLEVRGAQNNTIVPANAVAKFVGGDAGIFVGNLAGTPNYGAWLQAMRESDGLVFPLHLQPNGGNVGIGTNSPAQKLHVVGNGLYTGNLDVGHSVSTEDAAINLGTGRTGNGFAYIDLIGDTTYTDYGLRILRNNGGANTSSLIVHRGTGDFSIQNNEAANLVFLTAATERMRITSDGNVAINSTTTSGYRLYVNGSTWINGGTNFQDGVSIFRTESGAAEVMRIASNGNVGIGTTSPSEKLHVVGSTVTVGTSYLFSNTNASYYNSGANDLFHQFESYWDTNSASSIATYRFDVGTWRLWSLGTGSAVVTAKSNGNVGIGTTSPSGKLDVSDSAGTYMFNLTNADETAFRLRAYNHGTASAPGLAFTYGLYYNAQENTSIKFYRGGGITGGFMAFTTNDGSECMRITNTGNVGIGTTSPASESSLTLGAKSASEGGHLTLQKGTSQSNATHIDNFGNTFRIMGGSDSASGGVQFLLDHSAGNVGIGTTSPNAKLDVAGDIRLGGTATYNSVSVYNNSASGGGGYLAYQNGVVQAFFGAAGWYTGTTDTGVVIGTDSSSRPIRFYTDTERMRITGDGNVGIGTTSPGAKLHVVGTESRFGGVASGYISVYNANSRSGYLQANEGSDFRIASDTNDMTFYVNGSERMRITAAGNVGIGTTSPSTNLHVAGSVRVSGNNTNRLDLDGGVRITGQYYANGNTEYTYIDMYNNANASINIGTKHPLSYISFESGNGAYTERMRITNTGNVGIGTTAPVTQLQVTSATNAVDVLRIGNTAGDSGSVQGVTHLAINHFNAGTNPSTRITAYQDGVSGWPGGMYFSTRSLNTDSAPVERMRITSGGNVGIGTTSPSNILHITNVMRMDNATGNAPAVTSYTPRNGYGDVETERCLADPAVWLKINIGGTEYVIPAYTQA